MRAIKGKISYTPKCIPFVSMWTCSGYINSLSIANNNDTKWNKIKVKKRTKRQKSAAHTTTKDEWKKRDKKKEEHTEQLNERKPSKTNNTPFGGGISNIQYNIHNTHISKRHHIKWNKWNRQRDNAHMRWMKETTETHNSNNNNNETNYKKIVRGLFGLREAHISHSALLVIAFYSYFVYEP